MLLAGLLMFAGGCSSGYDSEDECIGYEGNDESVKKNYAFFDQEWEG